MELLRDNYSPLSRGSVQSALFDALGGYIGDQREFLRRVHVVDQWYSGISPEWLLSYVRTIPLLEGGPKPSNPEVFDCDDFCIFLRAQLSAFCFEKQARNPLAVGFLLLENHAMNFGIYPDLGARPKGEGVFIMDTQVADHPVAGNRAAIQALMNHYLASEIELLYI